MEKRRKSAVKAAFQLMLLLACGIVAGFLLLVAVYAIPVAPIANNVRLSVASLDGSWQTGEIPYEQLVKGYLTAQLDNTTDATMLLAAAHENDRPLLARAVQVPTYTYAGMYSALIEYGQSGTANLRSADSARYWLGFLVWLKPLLCFLSYMDIRILLMTFQLLLLCAVVAGLCRNGLARAVPAFALALVAVTPAITGFSMQFSSVYSLFLLGMAALLYCPRLTSTPYHTAAFFLLAGMATCYFDYLTYPIATFGMPYLLYLLLCPPPTKKAALQDMALMLGAWLAGYFGMWAGKWVLAALLSGDAWFVPNLLAKIAERGSMASKGAPIGVAAVFSAVLGVFCKRAYLLAGGVIAVAYAALLARVWRRRARDGQPALPAEVRAQRHARWPAIALTALLPPLWYVLTANHTYNHAFFTSRALVICVFAIALLLTPPVPGSRARNNGNGA